MTVSLGFTVYILIVSCLRMVSMDALSAMKAMASDSRKRHILINDSTCMGGLVLVLSNPDSSVVSLALETLLFLAEDKELRPVIGQYMGILEQLETLLHRSQYKEVTRLADQLYSMLTEVPVEKIPLKDSSNSQSSVSRSRGVNKGKGTTKTKSVILQVRGVYDQADRDLCMRLLLRVKGVVSITFDVTKKQCLLRTTLDVKPEVLVRALERSMTMSAQQVIKNENGDETLLSFNMSGPTDNKENEIQMPHYLSDDEDEKHKNREEDKSALARNGKEGESAASKIFSAAANFITNSFFW